MNDLLTHEEIKKLSQYAVEHLHSCFSPVQPELFRRIVNTLEHLTISQDAVEECQHKIKQLERHIMAMREVFAQVAEKTPAWVTEDSYGAQVQMRKQIATSIRELKFAPCGEIKGKVLTITDEWTDKWDDVLKA